MTRLFSIYQRVIVSILGVLACSFSLMAGMTFLGIADAAPVSKVSQYVLDQSHTQVIFRVSHLGFSYVTGFFTRVNGEIAINDENPSESKVTIVIATDSVNTHFADRDDHLRKPDFFDAKKYPEIVFTSSKISKQNGNIYSVEGTLNLHGKVKPIKFPFTRLKTGPDMKGQTRTGGFANFVIKRSDFGMNYMNGPDKIGDEVEMTINLEAVLK
ncbi:MAG: YceI family protein [Bdellovibrionales bacterium]|nr:YceI family protein [Bdellovibrionales bacterium]